MCNNYCEVNLTLSFYFSLCGQLGNKCQKIVFVVTPPPPPPPVLVERKLPISSPCTVCHSQGRDAGKMVEKPVTKCDSGTQTDTHFMDSNIVKSYEWNEWELRRKAIKLVKYTSMLQCLFEAKHQTSVMILDYTLVMLFINTFWTSVCVLECILLVGFFVCLFVIVSMILCGFSIHLKIVSLVFDHTQVICWLLYIISAMFTWHSKFWIGLSKTYHQALKQKIVLDTDTEWLNVQAFKTWY